MTDDRRLIEDYLPIKAISAEASREKSLRKGHISTLHLWWARRPLVACRAAVYGALIPASQFVPENGPDNRKQSLGRANAAKFVTKLCKYPGNQHVIQEAQAHILDAHAKRLTTELLEAKKSGKWPRWIDEFKWPKNEEEVTREDIEAGKAPRPRVLDMFAGGGAIPLEALRLGCEAHALDLSPVAHIIELCTLLYPQKYGRSDPNVRGMTGPKNSKGETTWGGLADEVRYWGNWALGQVRREVGDLYPPIQDPEYKGKRPEIYFDRKTGHWMADRKGVGAEGSLFGKNYQKIEIPPGYLMPVAYLWTWTVKCKNPACGATVPLVKQTWLCKKKGRYVAMKMVPDKRTQCVQFEVVEATSETKLGFDPSVGSKGGNATCLFCGTVADSDYIKQQGIEKRMSQQIMALACTRANNPGKVYLSTEYLADQSCSDTNTLADRTQTVQNRASIPALTERIEINPRSMDVDRVGFTHWADVFTDRQLLTLMTITATILDSEKAMIASGNSRDHVTSLVTNLACNLGKFADFSSTLCIFNYTGGRGVKSSFPQQSLPVVWDFAETNPFNPAGASWISVCEGGPSVIDNLAEIRLAASVKRGSATRLDYSDGSYDGIITDPPYYDNVSYSNLSDFFYVWLRRAVGHLYPEHFATLTTPKKSEAIAASYRTGGNKAAANIRYEQMMEEAFDEANRTLKPHAPLVVVYAHKTTLGWSTLVDALRRSGFCVTEAWPLDTERKGRVIAMDTAALASSIFLVAHKRDEDETGSYESDVRSELEIIVRERVETLWRQGISGADLVISCVGAGLRAFTRFARVEYANGDEVPAERFLAEVEAVVLETILNRLSKELGGNGSRQHSLAGVDPATRFYILWRYTYRWTELAAGEAIIFANGTHVELDGPGSLSYGSRALIEKKKGKYRLLDFRDRGKNEKLGLSDDGTSAPLIDALHRTLWLMENRPTVLAEFLRDSRVNREQMRLVAQALAGPALKGGEVADVSPSSELSALARLTANWRSVVEDAALTPLERQARRDKQLALDFDKE